MSATDLTELASQRRYWEDLDTDEGIQPESTFVAAVDALLQSTQIQWCTTHKAHGLQFCWRAAYTDPMPDDAKPRCNMVPAVVVLTI